MEIYFKGKLVEKLKRFFFKKDNTLFQHLRGINIEGGEHGDVFVDPIYMPMFTFKLEGKVLFVDIAKRDGNFLTVILHTRFPFIYITDGKANLKKDDQ